MLLEGAVLTVKLTTVAVFFGIIIGTFTGMARLAHNKAVRKAAGVYVDFIRGTPLLVQVFLVYMGVPQIVQFAGGALFNRPDFTFVIPAPIAAAIAMSINSGAYVAEIVRAGIQSIDRGQTEAALSLGLTGAQTMRHIILPQAFRRIIPPLGNEFIAMLKDSSLVSAISLEELVRRGQMVITRTFRPFEIWITVALLYLVMTLVISRFVHWSEKKLKVGETL
ncbi:MAG TPA: amino acid ABC transporter permease [Firmicutes bacterium]|nr:amino acid ABC transporter permease [Bacillota bacterium]